MAQSKTELVTLQGVEHLEESELGRGAYGKVYKVKYGGAIFAAKRIHRILIDDDVSTQDKQSVVDGFISECEHCSSLNHPNVVKFLGICNPPKTKLNKVPVMVMEMLDESLTAYVERKSPEDVKFTVKVSILLDVACGLSYLHAQEPAVVHRDLSPNNILLKGSKMVNEYIVAKIADLGVAKAIKADSKKTQKKLSKVPGTVDFMPPEAIEENAVYDASLDVFSFGGIVLFLATHKWPTPTKLIETDPDTETIKAYSEVERRQIYLDMMTGEMGALKTLAIFCLSNYRSKRPTTVEICLRLKSLSTSKMAEVQVVEEQSSTQMLRAEDYLSPQSSPWFLGIFPDKETEGILEGLQDGVFAIREFDDRNEEYELCLRWNEKTNHIKISYNPQNKQYSISDSAKFDTIYDMVEYYKENELSSVVCELDTVLTYPYWEHIEHIGMHQPSKKQAMEKSSFTSGLWGWLKIPARKESPLSRHKQFISYIKLDIEPSAPTSSLIPFENTPQIHDACVMENKHPSSDDVNNEGYNKSEQLPTLPLREDREQGKQKTTHVPVTAVQPSFSSLGKKKVDSIDYDESDNPYSELKLLNAIAQEPPVEEQPWYFGNISRDNCAALLKRDGDYLVRYSTTTNGYVMTFCWKGKAIHGHIEKIKSKNSFSYYIGDPRSPKFSSVRELLLYYVKNQIAISIQQHILLRRPICKQNMPDGHPYPDIDHNNVELDKQPFSRGAYSDMYQAVLRDSGRCVTVKLCHKSYQKTHCLEEAEILKQCSHKNIVEFVGVCADVKPMYIITESMFDGILVHYLQEKMSDITEPQLITFCHQIASGMDYLTSNNYVHRDLQGSSCIVDEFGSNLMLKISDFHMAKKTTAGKFISDENECQTAAVKSTAPEVYETYEFTTASDVWSYGTLLYEIFSYGSQPYPGMDDKDIKRHVKQGYRMKPPEHTPSPMCKLMVLCWSDKPQKRPQFCDIINYIDSPSDIALDDGVSFIAENVTEENPTRKPDTSECVHDSSFAHAKKEKGTAKKSDNHDYFFHPFVPDDDTRKQQSPAELPGSITMQNDQPSLPSDDVNTQPPLLPPKDVTQQSEQSKSEYLQDSYFADDNLEKLQTTYQSSVAKSTQPLLSKNSVNSDNSIQQALTSCDDDPYSTDKLLEIIEYPIDEEPWCCGNISRDNAIQQLKADGDYLVRYSSNTKGYVTTLQFDGKHHHVKIQELRDQENHCSYTFSSKGPRCSNVRELFIHHVKNQVSVFEHNRIFLKRPICIWNRHKEQSHADMHHTDLVVDKQPISIGFYSDTYMAVLKVSGRCVTVQKCHPDYKKEQCLAGAEILKQCQHQNIVDFIGVCARGRPIYIITELMFGGNLVHYLQENKDSINTSQLISFCRHTASGMEYLTSSNYIHRDLQAANCMVDKFGNNLTLKISDFHLAKKITSGRFKSDANELKNIAVKWTAPEVYETYEFTTASDVWSYGILLYEIFSYGSQPYPGLDDENIKESVRQGYRMKAPKDTPLVICILMVRCLSLTPNKRPQFKDIICQIDNPSDIIGTVVVDGYDYTPEHVRKEIREAFDLGGNDDKK